MAITLLPQNSLAQDEPVPEQMEESTDEPIDEQTDEQSDESFEEDEGDTDGNTVDPDSIQPDPNPLNPVGTSLDRLIELQLNADMWAAMMGDLPCIEADETCIAQLQQLAIANNPALKAVDQRIEVVNERIEAAKQNNQRTVNLGILEPALQAFLSIETVPAVPAVRDVQGQIITPERPQQRRGFLNRIAQFFDSPLRGLNDIFALVGLPLFRNASGGDAAAQQRSIAIADLQVKMAEIENRRGDLANEIREKVNLEILDFDQTRREFQIAQEVARRETLRMKIREVDYRFAASNTDTSAFLGELSALDQKKADVFRHWARLRSRLVRVKLLVLGVEE
jgi:hypothetical protein